MNKNKIIMAAIGGVALVAVLAFGYLAFAAWSEQGENRERIENERNSVNRILSSDVPPVPESLERINDNARRIAAWRAETRDLLAKGDLVIDRSSSATSFKAEMGEDARALSKLPGGVEGKIVKEGFDFGFKSYIVDGNIPPEAELLPLKRQWAEVKAMVELLSASGAIELQSVEVAVPEKKAEPPPPPPRRGLGARRPKPQAEPPKPAYATMDYTLRFTARPLALVRVLNAFSASEHLMYVRGMTLVREKDMLGEMLGLGKKDADAASGTRRRRRGRKAEVEQEEGEGEEDSRKGLVTDPQIEAPFVATLKVTTFDFGTNGEAGGAAGEEAKPGEGKEDEE